MASSVSVSPMIRNGIHARIKMFDTKKIALAGALAYQFKINSYLIIVNIFLSKRHTTNLPIVLKMQIVLDS